MIEGIYNYCDRWCERCEFTKQCANFKIYRTHFPDNEDLNINNQRFWEKLHKIFDQTLKMIKEKAIEQGIDLESIDFDLAKNKEDVYHSKAKKFEITELSEVYINLVSSWFDRSNDSFKELAEDYKIKDELGLPILDSNKDIDELNNIVDVIQWYQHQIQVKIMRALMGKLEDNNTGENDFPNDSDGSAKVALIGIDRSISAWGKMLLYLPDKEDDLLKILVLLEQLRRKTEKVFPNARRPGFDTT